MKIKERASSIFKTKHPEAVSEEEKRERRKFLQHIQPSLFPTVTEEDIETVIFWLEYYDRTLKIIGDFEHHELDLYLTDAEGETARRFEDTDLHANKTENAYLYSEDRYQGYLRYKKITSNLRRAIGMIADNETKLAITYRYLEGVSYKQTVMHLKNVLSERSVARKIGKGVYQTAEHLKMMKVL